MSKSIGGSIIRSTDQQPPPPPTKTTPPMGFRQLFDEESCTYTYLLWDTQTLDAIIIDPVDTQSERDLEIVQTTPQQLNLLYGVNTHAHADHITGTAILKSRIEGFRSIISKSSEAQSDISIDDGDCIVFGNRYIKACATPGHTNGCISFVSDDQSFVLTGDTLLIRGCGRTDFQCGNSETLYESVHGRLFGCLPDDCVVYPAHDYKGRMSSTIGEEKRENPRLTKSKEEFVEIMDNLGLAYPKKIDVAVPANMRCGVQD